MVPVWELQIMRLGTTGKLVPSKYKCMLMSSTFVAPRKCIIV